MAQVVKWRVTCAGHPRTGACKHLASELITCIAAAHGTVPYRRYRWVLAIGSTAATDVILC
jgi:hypothetical protein